MPGLSPKPSSDRKLRNPFPRPPAALRPSLFTRLARLRMLLMLRVLRRGSLARLAGNALQAAVGSAVCAQDPEIVLGMLEIIFCRDVIARRRSIAGQSQIFFQNLIDGPANSRIRTVAFEDLGTRPVVRSSWVTSTARTLRV